MPSLIATGLLLALALMSWGIPALLLLSFMALVFLPFLPAVLEVYRPQDEYPLPVNMDYSKDPRYLGESGWRIVTEALGAGQRVPGSQTVRMSKEETVEVSKSRSLSRDAAIDNVLYVDGDLSAESGVLCDKDVYVTGNADFDSGCQLRAVACRGQLVIGIDSRVARWLDAEASVEAGDGCVLGNSVASGGMIRLGSNVEFKRLFGAPIATAGDGVSETETPAPDPAVPQNVEPVRDIEDTLSLHTDSLTLERDSKFDRSLLVKKDLDLREGASLQGSARVYGTTTIGPRAVVNGDVFCEGPIEVARGARVYGHLFSQETVTVAHGAVIGSRDRPKSVIAKKQIRLAHDVRIHGYVVTEGRGIVD